MRTERLDATTGTGRNVAVWRSTPDTPANTVAVLAPGFGQRMRGFGPLALFLTCNGVTVYRFDGLDHVGLSDGDIEQYSLTSQYDSLAATCDLARVTEGAATLTVIATSFAALSSYHYVAAEPSVERLICQLGVVIGRRTLAAVCGTDHADWAYEDLPAHVPIEKYDVDPRPLWRDHQNHGWLGKDATIQSLSRIRVPVVNFAAHEDEWVNAAEVHEVFKAAGDTGQREVVELPMTGHALLRNPVALQALFTEVTRLTLGLDAEAAIESPSFEEVLALRGSERELERQQRDGGETDRSRAVAKDT